MSDPHIDITGKAQDVELPSEQPPNVTGGGGGTLTPQHVYQIEQHMVTLADQVYNDPSTWPEMNNPQFEVTVINRGDHVGAVIYDKMSKELNVVFRGTASTGDLKQDLGFTVAAADDEKEKYGGHSPTLGAANTFEDLWGAEGDGPGLEEVLASYTDAGVTSFNVSGHSLGGAMTQMLMERTDEDGNNVLEKMGFAGPMTYAATYGAPTAFFDREDDDNPWHVPDGYHAYQLDWDVVVHMAQNWAEVTNSSDFQQFLDVIPLMLDAFGMDARGYYKANYVNYGDSEHGGRPNDGSIQRLQPQSGSQFVNFVLQFGEWLGNTVGSAVGLTDPKPFPFYHLMSWYGPAVNKMILVSGLPPNPTDDWQNMRSTMQDQLLSGILGDARTQWLMKWMHKRVKWGLMSLGADRLAFAKSAITRSPSLMGNLGIEGKWAGRSLWKVTESYGRTGTAATEQILREMNEMQFVEWTKGLGEAGLNKFLDMIDAVHAGMEDAFGVAFPGYEEWRNMNDTGLDGLWRSGAQHENELHDLFNARLEERIRQQTQRGVVYMEGDEAGQEITGALPEMGEVKAQGFPSDFPVDTPWGPAGKRAGALEAGDVVPQGPREFVETSHHPLSSYDTTDIYRKAEVEAKAFTNKGIGNTGGRRFGNEAGESFSMLTREEIDALGIESYWAADSARRGGSVFAQERFPGAFAEAGDAAILEGMHPPGAFGAEAGEMMGAAEMAEMAEAGGPFLEAMVAGAKVTAYTLEVVYRGMADLASITGGPLVQLIRLALGATSNVHHLALAAIHGSGELMFHGLYKAEIYLKNAWATRSTEMSMKEAFAGSEQNLARLGKWMQTQGGQLKSWLIDQNGFRRWIGQTLEKFSQQLFSAFATSVETMKTWMKNAIAPDSWGSLWLQKLHTQGKYRMHSFDDPVVAEQFAEDAMKADEAFTNAFSVWKSRVTGYPSDAAMAGEFESKLFGAIGDRAYIRDMPFMQKIHEELVNVSGEGGTSFARNIESLEGLQFEFEPFLRKAYLQYNERMGVFTGAEETLAMETWAVEGTQFDFLTELSKLDPAMVRGMLENRVIMIGMDGQLVIDETSVIGSLWGKYSRGLAGNQKNPRDFYSTLKRAANEHFKRELGKAGVKETERVRGVGRQAELDLAEELRLMGPRTVHPIDLPATGPGDEVVEFDADIAGAEVDAEVRAARLDRLEEGIKKFGDDIEQFEMEVAELEREAAEAGDAASLAEMERTLKISKTHAAEDYLEMRNQRTNFIEEMQRKEMRSTIEIEEIEPIAAGELDIVSWSDFMEYTQQSANSVNRVRAQLEKHLKDDKRAGRDTSWYDETIRKEAREHDALDFEEEMMGGTEEARDAAPMDWDTGPDLGPRHREALKYDPEAESRLPGGEPGHEPPGRPPGPTDGRPTDYEDPEAGADFDEDAKEEGELQEEKEGEPEITPEETPETPPEIEGADATPTEGVPAANDTEAIKAHIGRSEEQWADMMKKELTAEEMANPLAKETWIRTQLRKNGFTAESVEMFSREEIAACTVMSDSSVFRARLSVGGALGKGWEFINTPAGNGLVIAAVFTWEIASYKNATPGMTWSKAAKHVFSKLASDLTLDPKGDIAQDMYDRMATEEKWALQLGAWSTVLGIGSAGAGLTAGAFGTWGFGLYSGATITGATAGVGFGMAMATLATVAFALSALVATAAFLAGAYASAKAELRHEEGQLEVLKSYGYAAGTYDADGWAIVSSGFDHSTTEIKDDPEVQLGLQMASQQAFGVDLDVYFQLDKQNEYTKTVATGEHTTREDLHTHTGNMSGQINTYYHDAHGGFISHAAGAYGNTRTWNNANIWIYRLPQILMLQTEAENWLRKRSMTHPDEKGIPWYLDGDVQSMKYRTNQYGELMKDKYGEPYVDNITDFSVGNWEEWSTYRPREGTDDPSGYNYARMKQAIMTNMEDIFHSSDIEEGMTEYKGDYGKGDYQGEGTDYRYGNIGRAYLEADNDLAEEESEAMRKYQAKLAAEGLAQYDWGEAYHQHVVEFAAEGGSGMMLDTQASMLQYVRHATTDPTQRFQSRQFIQYMATEYDHYVEATSGAVGALGSIKPTDWLTMSISPDTGEPMSDVAGVPRWQTVDVKFSDTFGSYDIMTKVGSADNPEGISRNGQISDMVFQNCLLTGFESSSVGMLTSYLQTQVWTPIYDSGSEMFDVDDANHGIPKLTSIAQVPDEFRSVMELIAYMPDAVKNKFGGHFSMITALFVGGTKGAAAEYLEIMRASGGLVPKVGGGWVSGEDATAEMAEALMHGWFTEAEENKATGLPPEAFQSESYKKQKEEEDALDEYYEYKPWDHPGQGSWGGKGRKTLAADRGQGIVAGDQHQQRPFGEDPATWTPQHLKDEKPVFELEFERMMDMGLGYEAYADTRYVQGYLEDLGYTLNGELLYDLAGQIAEGKEKNWDGEAEPYYLGNLVKGMPDLFADTGAYNEWLASFDTEKDKDGDTGEDGPHIDPGEEPWDKNWEDDWEEWINSQQWDMSDGSINQWFARNEGISTDSFHPHSLKARQEPPNVYHPPHGPSVVSVARDFYNHAMMIKPDPNKVFMLMTGMEVDEEFI